MLAEVDRLAREDLAASYATGDRNPPVFDPATHTAPLPEEFHRSYEAFMASEFWRLDLPAELGGTQRAADAVVVAGRDGARLQRTDLDVRLRPVVRAHPVPSRARRSRRSGPSSSSRSGWGSTMVLTEPDAGSDVGAGRARAIPQPDGSWHIEGVKRFITSGEHDLSDNIIHYVLARPVGVDGVGGPGTKGLSLFVVPKFHFDPQTGELGERNGVFATNVEHKMGLKVSNTCELTFGEHGIPAKGWLLGDVHEGIRQMFLIIEYARMMVGTKAIATLSTGYLNALEYAKSRVQGADLLRQGDKTAPRVTITHHPDVRRSLALQKAYAEGLRALVCYTAAWQDRVHLAEHAGDEAAAKAAERVNDLLLPLVKGCGSERAYELLGHESLQTFGGSGYLQDYPLEQYVRDAKIDTLYEGTTAIQSLDLIFRKIVKDGGRALGRGRRRDPVLPGHVRPATASSRRSGSRSAPRSPTCRACSPRSPAGWAPSGGDPTELYKVGLSSRRILLALGDLVVGWLLQRQAEVALAALGRDGVSERGPGLLPGQGRLGPVLRPRGAAASGQRPAHRRSDHSGHHGAAGGGLLVSVAAQTGSP